MKVFTLLMLLFFSLTFSACKEEEIKEETSSSDSYSNVEKDSSNLYSRSYEKCTDVKDYLFINGKQDPYYSMNRDLLTYKEDLINLYIESIGYELGESAEIEDTQNREFIETCLGDVLILAGVKDLEIPISLMNDSKYFDYRTSDYDMFFAMAVAELSSPNSKSVLESKKILLEKLLEHMGNELKYETYSKYLRSELEKNFSKYGNEE
ncbi:MAG: hypothetical protein OIF32_02375 [Campylobacterales bacterium]|nr:hypothetical protein [Campylobacterales bacterium]